MATDLTPARLHPFGYRELFVVVLLVPITQVLFDIRSRVKVIGIDQAVILLRGVHCRACIVPAQASGIQLCVPVELKPAGRA